MQSFSKRGDDVLYIQKYTWDGSDGASNVEIMRRPEFSISEKQQLSHRYRHYSAMSFLIRSSGITLKQENKEIEGITICPVEPDYKYLYPLKILQGNFITTRQNASGSPVAVLGYDVWQALFGKADILGKKVTYDGRKLTIIGILEKEGTGLSGMTSDKMVYITLNFFVQNGGKTDQNSTIILKAAEGVSIAQAKNEVTAIIRAIRKLRTGEKNNFGVNTISSVLEKVQEFFGVLSLVGWILAGFSILVGGFGIANIMFVTVKERTPLIGVEKALGAPDYYILSQFLGEAVMLCLMGGLAGFAAVAGIALVFNQFSEFQIYVSLGNLLNAMVLSSGIGIVSGIIPAYKASKLTPVEAMRSV